MSSFDEYTVLLYYHYVPIENPQELCDWQIEICGRLDLNGRIRVAREGLNGTLGGTAASIQAYIQEMKNKEELKPESIDWKLSGAVDRYDIQAQQFTSLSAKVTKEVVSLDLTKKEYMGMMEAGPGQHLTAQQFHEEIERHCNAVNAAEACAEDVPPTSTPMVLFDCRNVYETEIGRFEVPQEEGKGGVPVIDPHTRKFSDFKRYVDTHTEEFDNKKVLMYCTGGVKCERASAYVKLRVPTSEVYQLTGGIHNYQEAFPDGGYFRGKNFVYDPRKAVPSRNKVETVGKCRVCDALYDDYAPQVRCNKCRILQLVCDSCREGDESFLENGIVCTMCASKE